MSRHEDRRKTEERALKKLAKKLDKAKVVTRRKKIN